MAQYDPYGAPFDDDSAGGGSSSSSLNLKKVIAIIVGFIGIAVTAYGAYNIFLAGNSGSEDTPQWALPVTVVGMGVAVLSARYVSRSRSSY